MTLAQRLLFATCSGVLLVALTVSLASAEEALPDHPDYSVSKALVVPRERGEDGTRPIGDGRPPPYAAVGRLIGSMVCTAAVVAHPRIIITAAHCVTAVDGSFSRARAIFHPAKRASAERDHFEATVWAVGAPQRLTGQSTRDAANDWAILVLDRAPMGIRPLRVRRPSASDLARLERRVLMPSYAIDGTGKLALNIGPACSIRGLRWSVLLHDCKASPGASGAPLLVQDRRWYAVVGLHSSSLLVVDIESGKLTFAGHSAVGVWAFAGALETVVRHLQGGDNHESSAALGH